MPKTSDQRNKEGLQINEDLIATFSRAIRPPSLPDIITFAESSKFCGKKLFPRQKTLLKLLFLEKENFTDYDLEVIDEWSSNLLNGGDREGIAPDIMRRIDWCIENGFPHFREAELIVGRRGGKGHLGGIIGAYLCWRMITYDNPQRHYDIDPNKDLYMFVTATSQSTARDNQFKDIAETITYAPCFAPYISTNKGLYLSLRTPADIRKVAVLQQRKKNSTLEREVASVRIMALSSNSRAGRGHAAFALFFDEMAHMLTGTEGPNTAEEVYKALTPALSQVGKDAFIYIPSSPYTKVGAAYKIYEAGLETDIETKEPINPNIFIAQLPSWAPYEDSDRPDVMPKPRKPVVQYDEELKRLEVRNPEAFKVEYRSQWAEVVDAYLRSEIVDEMFDPILLPNGETRTLTNFTPGRGEWEYRAHVDPSASNANTALAIGHTEPIIDPETEEITHHVFFDWLQVWKPSDFPDGRIDYLQIQDEIVNIAMKFPTLRSLSYDQYGAFVTVKLLQSHLRAAKHKARVHEITATAKSNDIRSERFKSALYMGWLHSPIDRYGVEGACLLSEELKYLQLKNGRVAKQDVGPVTTKDLFDAASTVASELLKDQLERYERNRNLGSVKLSLGAPGGYHSNRNGQYQPGGAHDKLNQIGMSNSSKKSYGVSW